MNLKSNIRYIATKRGDDGTIIKGDILRLAKDGSLVNINANGWIDAEDVEEAMRGVEAKVDIDWYQNQRNALRKQIEEIEQLLLEESCTPNDTL